MNSNERQPPPSRPAPPEHPRRSILPVLLALALALVLFLGLIVIAGPLGPVVLAIGGIVFLLIAATAGHYLLWGYWLSDSIRREVEEEEERESNDG